MRLGFRKVERGSRSARATTDHSSAVLTWHHGYRVAESAVRAFVAAGFTLQHYELLAGSIVSARAKRRSNSR